MGTGQTKIMGIINLDDDSFFAASRVSTVDDFRRRVDMMIDRGVDIIDIGACSSRPGASFISAEQEWERLEPALQAVADHYRGYSFSIDTFRPSIVLMAYQTMGRFIVNDISSGEWEEAMLPVVGRLGLRYVAMHHQGSFETMHDRYEYDDVVASVKDYFTEFSQRAEDAGVSDWILDPGFGFSKSTEDNVKLLEGLSQLKIFRRPILVGISRKRFVREVSGTGLEDCGRANSALEAKAVANGAAIIRTHIVQ